MHGVLCYSPFWRGVELTNRCFGPLDLRQWRAYPYLWQRFLDGGSATTSCGYLCRHLHPAGERDGLAQQDQSVNVADFLQRPGHAPVLHGSSSTSCMDHDALDVVGQLSVR